jgi:hypothetical protein
MKCWAGDPDMLPHGYSSSDLPAVVAPTLLAAERGDGLADTFS